LWNNTICAVKNCQINCNEWPSALLWWWNTIKINCKNKYENAKKQANESYYLPLW
jgi:hypothetical protein